MSDTAANNGHFRRRLETGMHPQWKRVEAGLLDAFAAEYARSDFAARESGLIEFLLAVILEARDAVLALRAHRAEFNRRHAASATADDRRENILEYARTLGANERQIAGDRRAFRRWFGHDAMLDRFARRIGDLEHRAAFAAGRLGVLGRLHLEKTPDRVAYWRALGIEDRLEPLLAWDGDARLCAAVFACLSKMLAALPDGTAGDAFVLNLRNYCLDRRQDVWIQCEALRLLRTVSPPWFQRAAEVRLTQPAEGDDLFVRRRTILLVGESLEDIPALAALFPAAAADPSPFVRQALAEALRDARVADIETHLTALVTGDDCAPVRAAALLACLPLLAREDALGPVGRILRAALDSETDAYVLRVALKVAVDGHAALLDGAREWEASEWRNYLLGAIAKLHTDCPELAARRWAAQARERIWCRARPEAGALRERLEAGLENVAPGTQRRLPLSTFEGSSKETLGRVLSVMSQEDFGFDVEPSPRNHRITRGHIFGRRLWRFLYEWIHPSPDKRQAFQHTVGRIFYGTLRVPSALLSEMSQTKVPGEPLTMSSEAGWRPYLPLVDDVISSLDEAAPGNPLRIVTSEGITTLAPPRSLKKRLRARTALTRRFAHYAQLRNWEEGEGGNPSDYVAALRELGFEAHFDPWPEENEFPLSADPAVARFFSLHPALAAFGLAALPTAELWQRIKSYFYSVYENSLTELALFLAGAASYFFGRHIYLNHRFRVARENVPLVVGGWGTRGKSGTERIKAALFNAVGHRMVSKTTGCEAMFIYSDTFGKMRELFLFRPYDKATIWEQADIVQLSAHLEAKVFLWECMGLTPSYIEILQRHWMKDDISTIVNTYPDHEDLQGPAGINIPEVMTNFIRAGGKMLTSEQQMTPVLTEAARELDSEIDVVGWLEPGLLTPDVLDRYPYAEHPNNIALVIRLGEELGIAPDFAVKEMADRVVPDLGVLKIYPVARLDSRRLEFVNGMSANERFGCLGNWKRVGFDSQDPVAEPGVWISTVVNNRADRIARSRVFANILVEDVSADRHFLIGSNLEGMLGYIRDAWGDYARTLSLSGGGESESETGGSTPAGRFRAMTLRFRLPAEKAHVTARLEKMLEPFIDDQAERESLAARWENAEELRGILEKHERAAPHAASILATLEHDARALSEFDSLRQKIESSGASETLDAEYRALLWTWFERKLVVVWDYHASGNQVIRRICDETPPGYLNRVMGVQNIKGTGLDFVYRWQAWDQCHVACVQLLDRDPKTAREGMAALAAFKDHGILCEEHLLDTAEKAKEGIAAKDETVAAELDLVLATMKKPLDEIKAGLVSDAGDDGDGEGTSPGWKAAILERVAALLENFLDPGDAVRRRKTANQVYKDMAAERISAAQAAYEIQLLNKRQKGGWFVKRMKERFGF